MCCKDGIRCLVTLSCSYRDSFKQCKDYTLSLMNFSFYHILVEMNCWSSLFSSVKLTTGILNVITVSLFAVASYIRDISSKTTSSPNHYPADNSITYALLTVREI